MIIDTNTHSSQINNAKSIGIDFNGANMSQSIVTDKQFSFAARELPARILEYSQAGEIGYWQHQFDRLAGREPIFYWNVGIANGQSCIYPVVIPGVFEGVSQFAMTKHVRKKFAASVQPACDTLEQDLVVA